MFPVLTSPCSLSYGDSMRGIGLIILTLQESEDHISQKHQTLFQPPGDTQSSFQWLSPDCISTYTRHYMFSLTYVLENTHKLLFVSCCCDINSLRTSAYQLLQAIMLIFSFGKGHLFLYFCLVIYERIHISGLGVNLTFRNA